ncbi:hypothetical protein CHLNCDRAFT_53041 [Chlorella variabilis]|uniref:Pseudouridine synthase RsuA/RluA-like domain-containing protein n=1 Tax=Chlorella variabilis TaxID=554065 RepID=E1ZI14_CHLVA|nr:hypothetical protein CHLNCDRAFT_53041 [Chlorella variabilis]EFN54555.1 hypothetical protein CHLNCDRAFT_53041 [Chlorella variabilis]|eukprot:XP_005846657.1 hypothetical protein CHLNCDRAFT_53041 [Chlorella variabilis]
MPVLLQCAALRLLSRSRAIALPLRRSIAVRESSATRPRHLPALRAGGGGGGRAALHAAAGSASLPRASASAAGRQAEAMHPDSPQQQQQREQQLKQKHRRPALWWKERPSYRCPACGQCCFRVPAFEAHILRCCPDVAPPDEWRQLLDDAERQRRQQQAAPPAAPAAAAAAAAVAEPDQGQQRSKELSQRGEQQQPGEQRRRGQAAAPRLPVHSADAAIRAWLTRVQRREDEQRERALDIAFRQRGADGEPLRQGPAEIAQQLGLPAARAELLLQIRVHLAHAGHAILGDDLYGATGPWIARHALHAAAVTIRHPRSGELLTVRAPLPADFLAAMEQLGLQQPGTGPGAAPAAASDAEAAAA